MSKCQHCGAEHPKDLRFCPETGKVISPERLYPPGTLLEQKYRIGKPLGIGGMGAVFEGTHTLLDRRVAIKLLLPEFAADKEMAQRLMREARAAGATGHRNIVAVTDMGFTDDHSLFMVMEYVSGRTLKEVIDAEAPLDVARACLLMDQILAALEVVHKKGIIHRDLKPNNVITYIDDEGEETLKILDFGISKVTDDLSLSNLTTIGKVMGTPKYMAPEQAVGQSDLDHRADIYACGAILYELLTGRPPLVAKNYNAMIAMLLQGEITPPQQVQRSVPAGLGEVVMRALARRPEERLPDANIFRRSIRRYGEVDWEDTDLGLGAAVVSLAPAGAALGSAPQRPDEVERLVETAAAPSVIAHAAGETAAVAAPEQQAERPPAASSTARQPKPDEAGSKPVSWDRDLDLEIEPLGGVGWDRLDLGKSTSVQPREPAPKGTLYRGGGGGQVLMKWGAVVVLIAVAAGALWHFKDPILGLVTGRPHISKTVMLLIQTVPRDADVYVDGVLAVTKPVELPRSDRLFDVKVSASGYLTEVRQVRANRTRSLQVTLRRR
jgi:tRNA A-37 threonylcarbamoyl transferase component Bud32